jgi:maltoporin
MIIILLLLVLIPTSLFAESETQFIGYFRTTVGTSEGGGMPAFSAPGAAAKYRLGNEPDTVFEAGVDHRFAPGREAPTNSYLQGVFMLNGYAPVGGSNSLNGAGLVQAYVKMARYFGDFDVWLGRRYYQRQAIDINDYFWLNTAQGAHVGTGLEEWKLGPGFLDFAVMNYEDTAPSAKDPTASNGTLHSRLFELRYRDIALGDQWKLSSWLSHTDRPWNPDLGYERASGQGGALWLDYQNEGLRNRLAFQYRQGLGMVQGPTDARPIRETQGYTIDEARLMEAHNFLQWDTAEMALQFLVLTHQERKNADEGELSWNSIGARPVFYLNQFHSLALEVGHDQVKNEVNDTEGSVTKETIAWQLMKEKSAGARPLIRLFVTQAQWSEDLKGSVGGSYFQDNRAGWSAGLQTEVWW